MVRGRPTLRADSEGALPRRRRAPPAPAAQLDPTASNDRPTPLSSPAPLPPTIARWRNKAAAAGIHLRRGKSERTRAAVVGSAHPSDLITAVTGEGQRHREQTADGRADFSAYPAQARVKRCGKSAPLRWRQRGHGKPHRAQGQTASGAAPREWTTAHARPGRQEAGRPLGRVAPRAARPRAPATVSAEKWPPPPAGPTSPRQWSPGNHRQGQNSAYQLRPTASRAPGKPGARGRFESAHSKFKGGKAGTRRAQSEVEFAGPQEPGPAGR
jgi:hypothetical protein